jgi:hypothetical protein
VLLSTPCDFKAVAPSMISATSVNADGTQGNSAFAADINGDGIQDIRLSLPPGVNVRFVDNTNCPTR